ncbi:MAG TPA: MAPEG family protein [Steroidobacteraceae bacterium]|nr:MAPEG family protein [Steroidobacteraceae bacterium]
MTVALWCVFIAGLLPYAAALTAKAGAPDFDNNEPRAWLAKQTGFRARANAAQQNSFEAFAFFAVAVLVAHVTRGPQAQVDTLAMVFIAARVLYIAMYLGGWGTIRSLVWAVGIIATVWIFLTAAIPR